MHKLRAVLFLTAGIWLLVTGCSNKNSDEACRHEVTMNLDSGNYDAVLASGCADAMQRGAAYFGRAGFDAKNVIDQFIDTGLVSGQASTASDFSVYMNTLVTKVTTTTLSDLDNSLLEYQLVSQGSDSTSGIFRDAQFNISLVDAVKGLSLMKTVIDSGGLGVLNAACDADNNGSPDEIGATQCALLTADLQACTGGAAIVEDHQDITISENGSAVPGSYRGLVVEVSGTGSNTAGCPDPNQYRRLLYATGSATLPWAAATTVAGPPACTGSDGEPWPCPILDGSGQPLDLVHTIDQSLNASVSALDSSLTATTGNNVQTAIQDIKDTACPGGTCTATDIAGYLSTYNLP